MWYVGGQTVEGLKAPGVGMSLNKCEVLGAGLVEQERIRGKQFLQVGGHVVWG